MDKKDCIITFGFDKESGTNISMVTMNPMAYLMCPECFEKYKVEQKGFISSEMTNPHSSELGKPQMDLNFAVHVKYACECQTCGKMVELFPVDQDLADIIRILNRNNYTTVSCCEGHSNDIYKRMFIKFANDIKLPSIPEGWSYKSEDNIIEVDYKTDQQFHTAISNLHNWLRSDICRVSEDGSDWDYEQWIKETGRDKNSSVKSSKLNDLLKQAEGNGSDSMSQYDYAKSLKERK